jgi:2-iminobutanoate/2-iminopropanoate deaminase
MKRQIVATDAAPKAIGPYSQAVCVGDYMFCAGQIPLDPATGNMVPGGIFEQTTRVLENINGLLRSQGLSFSNVVKTTVFLSDMNNFAAMNGCTGSISSKISLRARRCRWRGCPRTRWWRSKWWPADDGQFIGKRSACRRLGFADRGGRPTTPQLNGVLYCLARR